MSVTTTMTLSVPVKVVGSLRTSARSLCARPERNACFQWPNSCFFTPLDKCAA
jgi:hypothetical protein